MGWSMIIVMLLIKQKNNDRKERYQQSRYVISSETIATSIRFSPAAAVSCRLLIVAGPNPSSTGYGIRLHTMPSTYGKKKSQQAAHESKQKVWRAQSGKSRSTDGNPVKVRDLVQLSSDGKLL
jgi:hypothetical protein